MGKKLPPRKVSVVVTSRHPSKGLINPIVYNSQPSQEEYGVACVVPGRDPSSPHHFSQALHELKDEDQVCYKLPHLPPSEEELEKGEEDHDQEGPASSTRGADRRWAYKNVFGVGLSALFVFAAFFSLQNLQSSINSDGGLGLTNLAILYLFFVSSGFISPSVLKILGTKYSLLAGFSCFLVYTFANFFPSWYTLVPASVAAGVGSALVWAAANTHIVNVAVLIAPKLGVEKNHLISIYTGLFFCFVQTSQIPGNLASSLILFPYSDSNSTVNSSTTGSCQHSTDASGGEFELQYWYILCAILSLFGFMGILFAALMVDNLGTDKAFMSSKRRSAVFFKAPLIELLRVMKNYKMLLIAPVSVFNGLELSFAFGTLTALVAKCFGTYQVGFTLIAWGISSGTMSLVYGKLAKCIPMLCIFFFGGVINVALLVFLLLWSPVPSYGAIFSFAVFWGAADGVWNTMTTSMTGILFPTKSDSAFSALRIWLAIGFTSGFIAAELLDRHSQIWLMLGAVIVALSCTLAIELVTRLNLSCPCTRRSYSVNRVSADCDTATPQVIAAINPLS